MLPQFSDRHSIMLSLSHDNEKDDCVEKKQDSAKDKQDIIKVIEDILEQILEKQCEEMPILQNEHYLSEKTRGYTRNTLGDRLNVEAPEIISQHLNVRISESCPASIAPALTKCYALKEERVSESENVQNIAVSPPDNRNVPSKNCFQEDSRNGMTNQNLSESLDSESQVQQQTFDRYFNCPNDGCDKIFKFRIALVSHIRNCVKESRSVVSAVAQKHFPCPYVDCKKIFRLKSALRLHVQRCPKKPEGLTTNEQNSLQDTSSLDTDKATKQESPPLIMKVTPQGLMYQCHHIGCNKQFTSLRGCRRHSVLCRSQFPEVERQEVTTQVETVSFETQQRLLYKCPHDGCIKRFSSLKGSLIHAGSCKFQPSDNEKLQSKEELQVARRFDGASPRQAAIKAKNNLKAMVESTNYRNWKRINKYREDYVCKGEATFESKRRKNRTPDLRFATLEIINHWSEEIQEKGGVRCDVDKCNMAFDNEVDMLNHWKRCGIKESRDLKEFSWSQFYKRRRKRERNRLNQKLLRKCKRNNVSPPGSELKKLLQMPNVSRNNASKKSQFNSKCYEPKVNIYHTESELQQIFIHDYPRNEGIEMDFEEDTDDMYEPLPVECILKSCATQPSSKPEPVYDQPIEEFLLPDENPYDRPFRLNRAVIQPGRSLLKRSLQATQIKPEVYDLSD